ALDVAYTNDLIDCFCIVSGDSDYTPLVGKLKTMGKYVLGISRSEVASNIFIKACNEFIFLESVTTRSDIKISEDDDSYNDLSGLMDLLEKIISDQADEDGTMFVSELKKTLLRLKPDFSEKSYGPNSFGKLLNTLENRYRRLEVFGDHNSLKVKLVNKNKTQVGEITKTNWKTVMQAHLNKLKDNGFERVNPSIIKSELQKDYPDFDEYQIGFRKFSDLMKNLEKEDIVDIEFNEARTMLIKIK
ncbi:MAG TPA: NYN domain-containing protein, partial [Bacillota bacterium]|nr:NYN domain-containing protein [Bacillota bacterium]